MGNKVILFGAGGAGISFINNNTEYEVIAFTDNNQKVWGSSLMNIPVIKPTEIEQHSFDYIVVTSTWADSIQEQLVNVLNIPSNKVLVPSKSEIKSSNLPFEHLPTLLLAREAMVAVSEYLTNNGVSVYLDFGSLLGIIREGDIIPWDDDIDFTINESEFAVATELMKHFNSVAPKRNGIIWSVYKSMHDGVDISIGVKLIASENQEYKDFNIEIAKRRNRDGISELVGLNGLLYAPSNHFNGCEYIKAFDHDFCIPKEPYEYLCFIYGNWKEPIKEMTFQSYPNRKLVLEVDPSKLSFDKVNLNDINKK